MEKTSFEGGVAMKLLTNLMMKCHHHDQAAETHGGSDDRELEQRPYLDWLCVIIRFAMEHTHLLGFS